VAPVRSDNSIAPKGCDVIKVLPHIPHLLGGRSYTHEDYIALGEKVLDKLERMGLKDLRKHIVVKDILNPFDIEKMYYSNGGSIYGVVSDHIKNFAFKCPKRSKHHENCFFVGGSVNPGGGMPMVIQSGYSTAQMIKEQF
jgi:diapolycopene oxygenase